MTYAVHHRDLDCAVADRAGLQRKVAVKAASLLRGIIATVFQSREEQRNAAVAAFLARSGGRLTDDMEREIARRETASNWSFYQ